MVKKRQAHNGSLKRTVGAGADISRSGRSPQRRQCCKISVVLVLVLFPLATSFMPRTFAASSPLSFDAVCRQAVTLVREAAVREGVPASIMDIESLRQADTHTITRFSVVVSPPTTAEGLYQAIQTNTRPHGFTTIAVPTSERRITLNVTHGEKTCVEVLLILDEAPSLPFWEEEPVTPEPDAIEIEQDDDAVPPFEEETPLIPPEAADLEALPPAEAPIIPDDMPDVPPEPDPLEPTPPSEEAAPPVVPEAPVEDVPTLIPDTPDVEPTPDAPVEDVPPLIPDTPDDEPMPEAPVDDVPPVPDTPDDEPMPEAPVDDVPPVPDTPDVEPTPEAPVEDVPPLMPEDAAMPIPDEKATAHEDTDPDVLVVDVEELIASPEGEPAPIVDLRPGKIAIILDDGGYGGTVTQRTLTLSNKIALAILPDTPFAESTVRQAVAKKFDIMLHMPMQTNKNNTAHAFPGEITLDMTQEEIQERTRECIAQFPDAIGVNNHTGAGFTMDEERMKWFLEVVKDHELFFVDSRTTWKSRAYDVAASMKIPCARRDIFLDNSSDPDEIRKHLYKLIDRARAQGSAIGIGHFRPNTITVLKEELPKLESINIELVRISELVR